MDSAVMKSKEGLNRSRAAPERRCRSFVFTSLSEIEEILKKRKANSGKSKREEIEEETDPVLRTLSAKLAQFKDARLNRDLPTAFQLISDLKASLTAFRSLPPLLEETPNRLRELKLARDIHEQAVGLTGVHSKEPGAFDREYLQLKPYYEDPCASLLPPSHEKNMHLGYYLLGLLEQKRIADFHTELKPLSASDRAHSCIQNAIKMEKLLSEDRILGRRTIEKTTSNGMSGCSSLSGNVTEKVLKYEIHDRHMYRVWRKVPVQEEGSAPSV